MPPSPQKAPRPVEERSAPQRPADSARIEAKLCFLGHALMENRSAHFVDACLTKADGHAERVAALHIIESRADRPKRITLAADKG
jgi:hypothetical protein